MAPGDTTVPGDPVVTAGDTAVLGDPAMTPGDTTVLGDPAVTAGIVTQAAVVAQELKGPAAKGVELWGLPRAGGESPPREGPHLSPKAPDEDIGPGK